MDNQPQEQPVPTNTPPRKYKYPFLVALILIIASVGCGFLGGWLIGSANNISEDQASTTPELLFVADGDIVVKEDRLTIADELIEWFTNSPDRDAGHMTPQNFLGAWNQSDFPEVPPNAAFANIDAVVELSNPVLNQDGSLTFTFKVISGSLQNGTFADSALFIDAYPTTVNGQITDSVAQASSSDDYCMYNDAPWQVIAETKYTADTMSCDQRDQIMSDLFKQVEQKDYAFNITLTSDAPQANTEWVCSGVVRPLTNVSPWQLAGTECDPSNEALAKSYGFSIVGQTSLESQ